MAVIDPRSRRAKELSTPVSFNQGPEMQNYNRMMDLQSKASTFGGNDPRIQELKDARRQYNRFDKYRIGQEQGMSPLDVQSQFANQSEGLRTSAPDAYRTMYPITNAIMDYTSGGGLLGLAAKAGGNFLSNISDFGKDMFDKKGITGAVDTDEEEMQNYATSTFGMGTPYPQQDFFVDAETFGERDVDIPRMDDDVGASYEYDQDGNIVLSPERPMPFDDSNREAGIMSQYSTNFIGPRDDPNRRPNMFDVAGPRLIDRGLIPYPEYGPEIVGVVQQGRGELPGYPNMYDYDAERKGRRDSLRLQQLLDFINNQEIQQEPSRMNLR
jgi:hypothetical protein